jgi:predicted ATPase
LALHWRGADRDRHTTKERWFEAEVNRGAGEVLRRSPEWDADKVEAYFNHALSVSRAQRAKSWELRAAMSMARLWRDHGKRDEARELLAPVYGWFTEGFDTLDLKEAKCLVPRNRGALYHDLRRDELWGKFFTVASQRLRRSVEQYRIVKRA